MNAEANYIDEKVQELREKLYLAFGNSTRKFSQIDRYVHERMALWWRKKHNKNQAKWYKYMPWEKFKRSGVQILSGNIVYRSRCSKA